jgi:uracil-DNA glycosylase
VDRAGTRSARPLTTCSIASEPAAHAEEARFRAIFRRVHADHPACLSDEWLGTPCATANGVPLARPIVWSRRNGAWRRVPLLWIGAAPGNAGGRGSGTRGAHANRIPFGGDIAGANLDLLLNAMGVDRNGTFVAASLNHLPKAGGGEPTAAELAAPVGDVPSSVHLLRDTLLAAGARLVILLGNVALRAVIGAATLDAPRTGARRSLLPGAPRLGAAGLQRGVLTPWPAAEPPDAAFSARWQEAWGNAPLPHLLLCYHPSAQNMSPFAGAGTLFHTRMVETLAALRAAREQLFGPEPASAEVPGRDRGVYALQEWRASVAPYHDRLLALWRDRGIG